MQCNESGKMQELKDIRPVLKKSKKAKTKCNQIEYIKHQKSLKYFF